MAVLVRMGTIIPSCKGCNQLCTAFVEPLIDGLHNTAPDGKRRLPKVPGYSEQVIKTRIDPKDPLRIFRKFWLLYMVIQRDQNAELSMERLDFGLDVFQTTIL